jgi:hypothetical protein
MKILNSHACREWCYRHGFSVDALGKTEPEHDWIVKERFSIPPDAGKKIAFGQSLPSLVALSADSLLWITQTGVFPSCEYVPLFDGYRRGLGIKEGVRESPGHCMDGTDNASFVSILILALLFFWDFSIFDCDRAMVLSFSHDEVCDVCCQERSLSREIVDVYKSFGLQPLGKE